MSFVRDRVNTSSDLDLPIRVTEKDDLFGARRASAAWRRVSGRVVSQVRVAHEGAPLDQ
jgi:hypothetical protein